MKQPLDNGANFASRVLHDLGLLIGIQPRKSLALVDLPEVEIGNDLTFSGSQGLTQWIHAAIIAAPNLLSLLIDRTPRPHIQELNPQPSSVAVEECSEAKR